MKYRCEFIQLIIVLDPAPTVTRISPEIGILAGGTRLTLTGQNFPPSQVILLYGNYSATSIEACSPTTCIVLTPTAEPEDVENQLQITVIFPGYTPIPIHFVFVYKTNPQVNSVYPLKTLVAGGTTLTVQGEGFNAVSNPELIVYLIHTIKLYATIVNTNFTSSCTVKSPDTLKCPTPKLDLPNQFHEYVSTQEGSSDNEDSESYRWEIPGESLDFKLGILLDGDESYVDLSGSLPGYSLINVYVLEPEFDTFSGTKEVENRELLRVTGKRLDDGLDITDYTVKIGDGVCTMDVLSNNELLCVIPSEDSLAEEEDYSVLVHPGVNLGPAIIGNVLFA